MCCSRKVFAHATSIYDIDVDFYRYLGVKFLLIDLDNTLDSYKLYHPTNRAFILIDKIKEIGIIPIVVSNNRGKRVRTYAGDLNVEYINSAMKPFAYKIKKFMKSKNAINDEVMLIGDQMITDVGAANAAHIKVVLTDKIVKEDQWTTRFNRLFGSMIRRRHTRKGKLKDWRILYGKS